MRFEIVKDVLYDNETLEIIKEDPEGGTILLSKKMNKKIPSVHDSDWRPTLIFLASTECNLRCKYCYAHDGTYGNAHKSHFFTAEKFIEVYEHVRELHDGVKKISFFGGEPLLNFKAIRTFVEYLYENYDESEIPEMGVNTNGTIITDEILDFLEKYKITVGTSIDGTKQAHDANRISSANTGTYDLVIRNLNKMFERNIRVFVQYTFTRQHLEKYEKGMAVKWCKEMEALPICAYDVIPVSTNDERYKIDLSDENIKAKYIQFCEEITDYYLDCLANGTIERTPRLFVGMMLRLLMQMGQNECSAGYSYSVTPDGIMYPCHTFTEFREYGLNVAEIKDKKTLDEFKPYQEVRNANRCTGENCQKCIANKVCAIWCKGLQHSVNGDMSKELEERCVLMNIIVYKCIEFIATVYQEKKHEVTRKLVRFNETHI